MKKLLVLCTGNSCRSQMAHGYFAELLKGKMEIFSAGVEAHGVNPKSIIVMKEDGVNIISYTSNTMDEYLKIPFDYVITVCDNAKERCPVYLGSSEKFHHTFTDPHGAKGTEEEVLDVYRSVRDEIKVYCNNWVKQHVNDN